MTQEEAKKKKRELLKLAGLNTLAFLLVLGAIYCAVRFQPWTSIWLLILSSHISYDVKLSLINRRIDEVVKALAGAVDERDERPTNNN